MKKRILLFPSQDNSSGSSFIKSDKKEMWIDFQDSKGRFK